MPRPRLHDLERRAGRRGVAMRGPMSRTDTLWRWAFWTLAAGVLVLSLTPTAATLPTTGWDKSNHFVGFAALALAGRRAYRERGIALFAGLLVFGGMIEVLQSFTAYRLGDWADWIADGVGIIAGYALDRIGRRPDSDNSRD